MDGGKNDRLDVSFRVVVFYDSKHDFVAARFDLTVDGQKPNVSVVSGEPLPVAANDPPGVLGRVNVKMDKGDMIAVFKSMLSSLEANS